MDLRTNFSPNHNYLASASHDGVLKIYDVDTSTIKQQYTPSAHLTTTCTCLSWAPREVTEEVRAKRRKKVDIANSKDTNDLFAFGTLSGQVFIYSVKNGEIQAEFNKGHNARVNSICWSEDGQSIYSGSDDKFVVEWNASSGKLKRKWKAEKTGVKVLTLCKAHRRLLTGSRSIHLWCLDTEKLLRTFSAHSGSISHLAPFCMDQDKSYFLSSANGDRLVNIWNIDDERPIATITAASEIRRLSVNERVNPIIFTIVTNDGCVYLYEAVINGTCKPLTYSVHLTIAADDDENVLQQIGIVDANFTAAKRLVLAYGLNYLTIEELTYAGLEKETVLSRKLPKNDLIKEGTFRLEKDVIRKGKQVEIFDNSNMVLKRANFAHETSELLGSKDINKEKPTADNMAILLTQALKFQEKKTLNYILQQRDEDMIRKTVEKISYSAVIPLVNELMERLSGRAQGAITAMVWIKRVLSVHMSYLMNSKSATDLLQPLIDVLTNREQMHTKLCRLQGKIDLVIAQIASAKHEDDEDDEEKPAGLVYDDDSSDEENTAVGMQSMSPLNKLDDEGDMEVDDNHLEDESDESEDECIDVDEGDDDDEADDDDDDDEDD
ncbi:DgyrCDS748 [Dimorphilus gyrociliatus]|uniref:DgyrCDS748 n=1 Tax=Dimorphilus gyrociliatus TaxID=2664684 RepID=A0A7I8V5H6_9ANNE|nr:DgyrCDS748 [Dimorphilus gyrociliatus]